MAKSKAAKGVAQKHIHSRISYLHQIATYLHAVKAPELTGEQGDMPSIAGPGLADLTDGKASAIRDQAQARYLLNQVRGISLKATLRLSPALKHTICKRCDTLFIAGQTCTQEIQNDSKEGRKPWADVLVLKCKTCNTVKRFAIGIDRKHRSQKAGTGNGGAFPFRSGNAMEPARKAGLKNPNTRDFPEDSDIPATYACAS